MISQEVDCILQKYPSLDIKSEITNLPNNYFYFWNRLYSNMFYLHEITDHGEYISFNDYYGHWILRLWKDGSGGELINPYGLSIGDETIYNSLNANLIFIPELNQKRFTAIKRQWTIDKIKNHD